MEGICVNFLVQVKFLQFLKGRCHGNQFCGKNVAKLPTLPALIALSSETEWDIATSMSVLTAQMMPLYRVKISWMWSSKSRENGAHLCTFLRHGTGIFSQISQDIVDRFLQSFHHMKALLVQMMDFYLIFQFVKWRCHGNQIMLPNEGKLIPCAFFARSPDGRMVLFCYYLLGGNTAAPSRLYARLCHAFLVFSSLQVSWLYIPVVYTNNSLLLYSFHIVSALRRC